MLAKKFRLPLENNPLKGKKSFRGNYFISKKENNNLKFSRFGVIINKKTEKSSHGRNRMRRMIMDFARINRTHLVKKEDFLIIPLRAAFQGEKEKIEKELKKIFE